jgi:dTDP-4-amino-4,6-dideoxygalactose transaminase
MTTKSDSLVAFRVPAVDLTGQYDAMRGSIDAAIASVLTEGRFILGHRVDIFERAFAEYCSAEYAIGAASGTDALVLALLALGVGPGDEVITTPVTFIATASAIVRTGATPVFVDIERDTFNIDPRLVADALSPRTKAIVPVHLFGNPAEMDALERCASQAEAVIVADAAQATGARYRGRPVGTLGDAVAFSFFPTKNLGCYGDGGAVVTNGAHVASEVRMLRHHGLQQGEISQRHGFNSRLDALQAAILSVKLRHLDDELRQRRLVANRYAELLAGSSIEVPHHRPHCEHAYNQYTVTVPQARDDALEILRKNGVEARAYYATALHQHPSLRELAYREGQFPEAERYAAHAISLPCHPRLSEAQQEYVVKLLSRRYG